MQDQRYNPGTWLIAVWLAISGGLSLLIAPRAIGHDQAALLRNGVEIAQGGVPFRDVLDINSPVIHYFGAIPAGIAILTNTNPIPWFTVVIVLLSAWSAVLADRAIRALARGASLSERLAALAVPLGPCALHMVLAEPGQREHLFVLLYFPFLLYRAASAADVTVGSRGGRFLLGMAAAVGVAMKPHFLVAVMAAEAVLVIGSRRPRLLRAPEVWGAISFAALVAVGFALLPAAAIEVLTGQILPSIRDGYTSYGAPWSLLIRRASIRMALAVAGAAIAWRFGPRALRPAIAPVLGLCAGALASTLLQGKAFGYHYFPADAAVVFLVVAAGAGLVSLPRLAIFRPAFVVGTIAVLLVWRPFLTTVIARPDAYPFRAVLERHTRPGDTIMVMSVAPLFVAPAAMQLDRVDVARQSAFLLVLARQVDASTGTPGRLEGRVLRELASEIETRRPAVIFIPRDEPCSSCGPNQSPASILENDPGVGRALSAYRRDGLAMNFDVFKRASR